MSSPHRAKRSLGQNFLTDPGTQQRIVDALDPQPTDIVIEIGPGQGALTRHLAGRVKRLILVELDDSLAASLARLYEGRDDVDVIHQDFLTLDLCATIGAGTPFKAIGNIPYNITTPIIFRLLERACRPQQIVLMVQRELADRVLSPEGSKTYGALSVGVQALADVKRIFHVGRGSFHPVPNVDSTVIRITPHEPPRLSPQEELDLRSLTRTAFGWRRKQLQKILRSAPSYAVGADTVDLLERRAGTAMTARPETLSPAQFIELARALREHHLPLHSNDSFDREWE
jgi:16S rRNA (adenine1518-N6/adenine1519-N6)-dimethyltransferase